MTREREPTLEDLLNDTLVRQVMSTDGYSPDDFRNLFKKGGSPEGHAVSTHPSVADPVPVPAHVCAAALRTAKTRR